MADQTPQSQVDGFSDDTKSEKSGIGSPDPGTAEGALKPLSPEEYERLKEEARENE
jgi:hypothetical protein